MPNMRETTEDNQNPRTKRLPVCKWCGSTAHYQTFCQRRPHKPIKAGRPLKRIGKIGKKWLATRDKWLAQNKAPYYFCYICGKMLTRSQLTLDHVKSRSRHPELRFVLNNLQPCCWECNTKKGSEDG